MKRIFFIHSKNLAAAGKIKRLSKDDVIISLGKSSGKDAGAPDSKRCTTLDECAGELLTKKGKTRFGYNIDFLQRWAFTRSGKKKSFAEEMVFDGFSLWYQLEFFFLCDVDYQLGYELSIPGITLYIDLINDILDRNPDCEVVIENRDGQLNGIIIKVCEQRKVGVRVLGVTGIKKALSDRMMHNSRVLDSYIKMRIMLRRIIGAASAKRYPLAKILLLTSDRLSNKSNSEDYFWGPIIKELERKDGRGKGREKGDASYKVVEYDRIEALQGVKNIIRRYAPQRYDSQFIGTYYNWSTMAYYRRIRSFLTRKYRELRGERHFQKSFSYRNIDFYDLMEPRLKKIFIGFSSYISDTYAISKSMIEKEKPEVIVVDHEKNYYGRALITYAHLNKIPSVCLEGEIVYDTNNYLNHIPIASMDHASSPIWRPLADKKLLWGEINREWHEKKNRIPKDKLEVIGVPKYDFLKTLDVSDRERVRKKYGVKQGEKLITIITVLLPIEEEYVKACLASLNGAGKIHVIIKMHLTDPLSNKEKLERLLKKAKVKGDVVINENTSELIHASDLVTSYPSTLVYECIMLNKRVVILGGRNDLSQPYVKEGLIRLNTSINDFKSEIETALRKETRMNERVRERFIKKYLYSDDGRSSERAVNIILRFLKK